MAYEFAAKIWSFKQTILGAERTLRHFVRRLPITLPHDAQILDAGCGTGTLGLALLESHPTCRLVATDYNRDMLRHVERRATRIDPGLIRISIGQGDIQTPQRIHLYRSGQEVLLSPASFDLVIAGAVLEHVDITRTLSGLTSLVRPGGFLLINLMKPNPLTMLSKLYYRFHFLDSDDIVARLKALGYTSVQTVPFTLSEFPMNIYRVGILARR